MRHNLTVYETGRPPEREAYADLGTYLDLVKDHDGDLDVGITFNWRTREPVRLRRPSASNDALEADVFQFFTNIAQESGVLGEIIVQRMEYAIGAAYGRTVGMRRRRGEFYDVRSRGLNLRRRAKATDYLPEPIKCYGFPDAASAAFQNADFLAELSHQFDELMSSISYVGPLRDRPRRRYQWQGSSPTFVGPRGENTVASILTARRQNLIIKARPFEENLGYWLQRMGLIYQVRMRSSGQPGPGDAFLKWVLVNQANPARCHRVNISGIEVPEQLEGFDSADRKFICTALGCPQPRIAEAVDGLWWKRRADFEGAGIAVNFLCPEEIKVNSDRKHGPDVSE